MELPPLNRQRGALNLSTDELARRAHAEPLVGMVFVVVSDSLAQASKCGIGFRVGWDAKIGEWVSKGSPAPFRDRRLMGDVAAERHQLGTGCG